MRSGNGRRWGPWPLFKLTLVMAIATLITGHGLSVLIFSALGQPLNHTVGLLVLILHGCLMGVGLARCIPPYRHILAAGCTGALLGFFYGWTAFGEALRAAGVGAGVGLGLGIALGLWWRRGLAAIALVTALAATSSGAVFLLGTTAIAGLLARHPWGLVFTGLTLMQGRFTWQWTQELETMIRLEQEGGQDNPQDR